MDQCGWSVLAQALGASSSTMSLLEQASFVSDIEASETTTKADQKCWEKKAMLRDIPGIVMGLYNYTTV